MHGNQVFTPPEWAASAPTCALRLSVRRASEALSDVTITAERPCVTFGRSGDVTLLHDSVSRLHAAIVHDRTTGSPCLLDLGSSNGTFVGNLRVPSDAHLGAKHVLKNGDVIRFGASTRVFVVSGVNLPLPSSTSGSSQFTLSSSASLLSAKRTRHHDLVRQEDGTGAKRIRNEINDANNLSVEQGVKELKSGATTAKNVIMKKKGKKKKNSSRYPSDGCFLLPACSNKVVSSVALDPSGTRLAVGSMDHSVNLYNFGAMSVSCRPFRCFDPDPGHIVSTVQWNPRGNKLAIGCGSASAHIFDRDGKKLISCVRGDPYIADMAHTKGHVSAVTGVAWHPNESSRFVTSSIDGSVRIWHLDGKLAFGDLICHQVLKARNARGARVGVSSVAYSPTASFIAAVSEDGALQIWRTKDGKSSYGRPDFTMQSAHRTPLAAVGGSFGAAARRQVGSDALGSRADQPTCVCFSPDGLAIATRGGAGDNTIKLWDVRMLSQKKRPLKTFESVFTGGFNANMCFGEPGDGSLILAAGSNFRVAPDTSSTPSSTTSSSTSTHEQQSQRRRGELVFFRCKTSSSEAKFRRAFPPRCCPVTVAWNHKTQQIATGCSDGTCRILYDEKTSLGSTKGVLLVSSAARRGITTKKRVDGFARVNIDNIAINGADIGKVAAASKRRKIANSGAASTNTSGNGPALPDRDLRDVGSRGDQKSFTQVVMKHRTKNSIVNTDPRAALLKYNDAASSSQFWVGSAYAQTDPNRVLADTTLEQEEEDADKSS